MSTMYRSTDNFDSAEEMARDLMRDLPLQELEGAFAFLICLPETPYEELAGILGRKLPFSVVGGTTIAIPSAAEDDDISATLTVFSKQGVKHTISVSEPLKPEESRRQMTLLYEDCLTRHGETPKLLIPIMPTIPSMMQGYYMPDLFELAKDTPFTGGNISEAINSGDGAVLAEGQAYKDRMVLVAISGDIQPVFSAGCDLTVLTDYAPVVTEIDFNVIKKVDDLSFFDFLRRLNFDPYDPKILSGYPLCALVQGPHQSDDGVAEVRAVLGLDFETKSAIFSSIIPVGAKIRLGYLTVDDVQTSTQKCMKRLVEKLKASQALGHTYSLLFYVTCMGRYYTQINRNNPEGHYLTENLPEGLSLCGYYGHGEVSPMRDLNGQAFNRTHADSIVMCAF
ncbi:MAG: FIST C-terminal domain-containing protein [Desulfovibrio sp.]|jgi:hypothetical protein|nr:FIST C-terminal domain-containing protein [Desulfovibrio sp.]